MKKTLLIVLLALFVGVASIATTNSFAQKQGAACGTVVVEDSVGDGTVLIAVLDNMRISGCTQFDVLSLDPGVGKSWSVTGD